MSQRKDPALIDKYYEVEVQTISTAKMVLVAGTPKEAKMFAEMKAGFSAASPSTSMKIGAVQEVTQAEFDAFSGADDFTTLTPSPFGTLGMSEEEARRLMELARFDALTANQTGDPQQAIMDMGDLNEKIALANTPRTDELEDIKDGDVYNELGAEPDITDEYREVTKEEEDAANLAMAEELKARNPRRKRESLGLS